MLWDLELNVRTGDIRDQHKSMRTFTSKLLTGDLERFRPIFEEACALKRQLWTSHADVMREFSTKWEDKTEPDKNSGDDN